MLKFKNKLCTIVASVIFGLLVFQLLPAFVSSEPSKQEQVALQPTIPPEQPRVELPTAPVVPVGTAPAGNVVNAPVGPIIDYFYDPNSSVIFALGDITIADGDPHYIRYLSLYNIPKQERAAYGQTVSFIINSLSRRSRPEIPLFVGASDQTLIRINLKYYGIEPSAWDKLGREGSGPKPHGDPYFHSLIVSDDPVFEDKKVKKEKKVPTGRNKQDGTPEFRIETVEVIEKVETRSKRAVYTHAPWLDPLAISELVKALNAESPILRADWFICNAPLPPAYYNFLGLGDNLKDFEKLVLAEQKHEPSQRKAVVVKSTVARNNRTLTRSPILGAAQGYIWISHDSLDSVGTKDYVKNFLDEKFDATEVIATLPNGLQVYFLTDGVGKRLDEANPNIAIDNTAVDRIVRTGRSCMICHSDGIRPIGDEIRNITEMLTNREQVKLITPDEISWLRVRDLFGTNLDKQVIHDQQIYADAVAEVTGMDPVRNAAQLNMIYDRYVEKLLTKEEISREVGISLPELEKYIRGFDVGDGIRIGTNDNLLLGLIKSPIRPVRRDQWQQSFQGFMLTVMAIREEEKRRASGWRPIPVPDVPVVNPK